MASLVSVLSHTGNKRCPDLFCWPFICWVFRHQRLLCVRRQRLTERFIACKVLRPLLHALVYIHERNIVHR